MASPDPDISFNLRSNNDTSDNINTENQHHENDENDTQNHRPSVDRHMPDDDRFVNVTGDAEHYFSSNNNSSHTHIVKHNLVDHDSNIEVTLHPLQFQ